LGFVFVVEEALTTLAAQDGVHPRRAARDPLKGAMLAARQSQFRGMLGCAPAAPVA
jgi:hypothetical protein